MNLKKIIKEELKKIIKEGIEEFIDPDFSSFVNCVETLKKQEYEEDEIEEFYYDLEDCASKYYQYFSEGSYKKVYKIDDKLLLKIAKEEESKEDIKTEGDIFLQQRFSQILPKIYYKDRENLFLIVQKVYTFDDHYGQDIKEVIGSYLYNSKFEIFYRQFQDLKFMSLTDIDYRFYFGIESLLKYKRGNPEFNNKKYHKIFSNLEKIAQKHKIVIDFISSVLFLNQEGVTLDDFRKKNVGYVLDGNKYRLIALDLMMENQ